MKINLLLWHHKMLNTQKQNLKVLKNLLFLSFLGVFLMLPTGSKAQNAVIDLPNSTVTIEQLFAEIERQTDYLVVFSNREVDVKSSVSFAKKKAKVSELLDKAVERIGMKYEFTNKYIVFSKASSPQPQQQKGKYRVQGHVSDAAGEPAIGASVVEKGTQNGTVTGINGSFTLDVESSNSTIEISYLGHKSVSLRPQKDKMVTVSLREDAELLDEVVVVGYGTMKKKDLTGAVAVMNGEQVAERRSLQLANALQGQLSGVNVTRTSGDPSSTASIQVRGVTTIGDSSPLVIIDGVPGDLNQVSGEDVESISVLKDAASASIYGSRAAAGVILITTKRAKNNELSLGYNFEYGWEMPTAMSESVGAKRFMEMVNETRYNDNPSGGWFQTYTEDLISNYDANHAIDPYGYPDTDWNDVLIKNSTPRQSHTLSIAGGSKYVSTKASLRYDKNEGLYVNKKYDRYMVRVNNDFHINKFISANLDLNFSRSKSISPNSNPMSATERKTPAIYAVRWANGQWGDVKDGENMLAKITDGGTTTNNYITIGGKAGIDITPLEGLKISAVVAPNFYNTKIKAFNKQIPFYREDDSTTIAGYMGGYRTTSLAETRNDSHDITTQFFANYMKQIYKHNFTVMLGYEDYYSKWEYLGASRDQYQLTSFPYLDLGSEDYRDNSGSALEYAYRSFISRITYNYDNRYLAQVNFRRDGSSRFASDCRWANFPSISLGWVLSQEKFMQKIGWLSYLKIRASWGKLGNERIGSWSESIFTPSYYPYQASIDYGTALFEDRNGVVSSVTTAAQTTYAVHNITWETTETWDVGFDANFFDNRLTLTADWYKKKTKDMLLSLEIPHFIGYENPEVNAGNMHTNGFDIELGWRDHVGSFQYSIKANISDFTSKMGNLNGTEFLGNQVKMEGSEYNEWYGYRCLGIYQTEEQLENSATLNNNVKVGDLWYEDISGPDGVPDGSISPEYDRVLLGGSLPHWMYGLTFNGVWKGFDFGLTLQGVLNQNCRMTTGMVEGLVDNWTSFPTLIDGKYWSVNNTAEENLAAQFPRLTRTSRDANYCMSDYWLYNGCYLRVKNISLGYTLPKAITQKVYMKAVRIYATASDLLTISGAPSGWDPESNDTGYPITTSIVFGINVNF